MGKTVTISLKNLRSRLLPLLSVSVAEEWNEESASWALTGRSFGLSLELEAMGPDLLIVTIGETLVLEWGETMGDLDELVGGFDRTAPCVVISRSPGGAAEWWIEYGGEPVSPRQLTFSNRPVPRTSALQRIPIRQGEAVF
jgi:hypothetical protein